MLREDQIKWLSKLSDEVIVHIKPYDPKIKRVFEKKKRELLLLLGRDIDIHHRGASSLEISGKNDIDIYIPVHVEQFDVLLEKLKQVYELGSLSVLKRARFNTTLDDFKIEIFLVNEDSDEWKENVIFWNYLKENPAVRSTYEKIKAKAEGKSIREYYTIKTEFINDLMEQIS